MKSYLFSLGDSGTGPVGYCARVQAETPEEALAVLQRALPEDVAVDSLYGPQETDVAHVEYISAYFNADAITVADIDEDETEDVEEVPA